MSLPEPSFIDRDPQAITAAIIAEYEAASGKTLYPAQVERLLIDVIAYRDTVQRIGIQQAAKQNLVAFAVAPMLDYLGELVDTPRLPEQPASTKLRFTLATAIGTDLVIPSGTRAENAGAGVTFATNDAVILPAGSTAIDVFATCQIAGTFGNGWLPNQLNVLADYIAPGMSVTNLTTTANGAEIETDDNYRERIKIAPEQFSVAGPVGAYKYHTRRVSQLIVDVAIMNPVPGTVAVYPLLSTGLPDAPMLSSIDASLSGETVRPLNDKVVVSAPIVVNWTMNVSVTLLTGTDAVAVMAIINAAAVAYAADRSAGLGRDLIPSQIITALSTAGVYSIVVNSPTLTKVESNQWAQIVGTPTVNLTGFSDG